MFMFKEQYVNEQDAKCDTIVSTIDTINAKNV